MKTDDKVAAEINWHLNEVKFITPIDASTIHQQIHSMRPMHNAIPPVMLVFPKFEAWTRLLDLLQNAKLYHLLPEITQSYLAWQIGATQEGDVRFGPRGTETYPTTNAQIAAQPPAKPAAPLSSDIRDRIKVANTYTATDGTVFETHADAYKHEAWLDFVNLYTAQYGTPNQALDAAAVYDFLLKHGERLRIIIHIANGGR